MTAARTTAKTLAASSHVVPLNECISGGGRASECELYVEIQRKVRNGRGQ